MWPGGGVHGQGAYMARGWCAWLGVACMAGGVCIVGGHAWWGHVWPGGGVRGRGHAWQGACVTRTPTADTTATAYGQ